METVVSGSQAASPAAVWKWTVKTTAPGRKEDQQMTSANEGTSTDEGARDAGKEAQGGCRVEAAGVAGGRLCHKRWSLPTRVPRPVGGRCMPNSRTR
ncbi:hypothetical protein ACOMHN_008383 [Nucella lapillus]